MDKILQNVTNLKKVSECIDNNIRLSLQGLGAGEKSLVIHYLNKKAIIVCKDLVELNNIKYNLTNLGHKVGIITYGISSPIFSYKEQNIMMEFISNLFDFKLDKVEFLLVLVETLMQKLPDRSFLQKTAEYQINKEYKFSELEQTLCNLGYSRCDYVTKKSEYAIRGDIVDIFLINLDYPVRLDFFGDCLEKISMFDLDTMKSFEQLNCILIYPATIYFIENKEKINNLFNSQINKIKIKNDNYSKINEIKSHYLINLNNNSLPANDGFILPFFEFKNNILSLFNEQLVFIDEPKKIHDDFYSIYNNSLDSVNELIDKGELCEIHKNFYYNALNKIDNFYCIFDNYSSRHFLFDKQITFRTIGARKYLFNYKTLCTDINIYLASNYKVVLFCGSKESVNSIGTYLIQNKINYSTELNFYLNKGQVVLLEQTLETSASFLESGIILIATSDLVKRVKKVEQKRKRISAYLPKIGDHVVHSVHGIGKCVAIEKLNLNGIEKDYFILEYKGGDILYVPSEQANLISAFLGSDKEPKLNKIGGAEFLKIKEKVKASVKELAINLVKLYSDREKLKGHKYQSDNYLMDEFENAFEYELTYDQSQAVKDIKKDLYSGKIMDRLICGDVGYGKTEVALRAAYQVVLEGKQVAFLCPTTILSQQHYKTTTQRTKDFMCRVNVLNRFKTKHQSEQIIKELKNGDIDIIVGTHRLLSKDIEFKNLGLLILDEEHRFGVEDKEKIKNLKKDIDVLTLSATPIPRTLNMAMTGIRDISLIETAPKNRLPVQTFVVEESDALIVDACKRELSRDGQVLIVFNRVDKIYDFCEKIKQLIPDAKVGLAHGQMPERMLEDAILKLYDGQYNIMIATTLIENGIDLPRANTLIVIEADKLGLSQLYQLKGRIGRSDRLAYAYFTYNPNKILTQDAYKRLDAILEFTELGSGFKIAMRDLEIRGAGNVLGKEQHGHMEKVGYDMYCKLLEEAVSELRGKKQKQQLECKVDISCPAYLDDNYIKSEEERIKQYSLISEISSIEQLETIKQETQNIYGNIPKELISLYKVALIKNLCIEIQAKRILCNATTTKIYLYKKQEIISQSCANVLATYKDIAVLKFEDVPIIELNLKNLPMQDKLDFLIKFLKECTND